MCRSSTSQYQKYLKQYNDLTLIFILRAVSIHIIGKGWHIVFRTCAKLLKSWLLAIYVRTCRAYWSIYNDCVYTFYKKYDLLIYFQLTPVTDESGGNSIFRFEVFDTQKKRQHWKCSFRRLPLRFKNMKKPYWKDIINETYYEYTQTVCYSLASAATMKENLTGVTFGGQTLSWTEAIYCSAPLKKGRLWSL